MCFDEGVCSGTGKGVDLELIYGWIDNGYSVISNFGGYYDLRNSNAFDEVRPGVFDSGAFRWSPPLYVDADTDLSAGNYTYENLNLADDATLVVENDGNVTITQAFDVSNNSTIDVRNLNNGCEILRISSTPFATLAELQGNGFEIVGNDTLYGGDFFNTDDVMQRLRNIIRPADNSYTDQPANAAGDYINAYSLSVNSTNDALDVVFRSPGREVLLQPRQSAQSLNNAYVYQLSNPQGKMMRMEMVWCVF